MFRPGNALGQLSVRTRFLALLLLVGFVTFSIVAIGSSELAWRTERGARRTLRDSARYLARRHLSQWDSVAYEMAGLAATPAVASHCIALLKSLINHSPTPIDIAGMINADGHIHCVARPGPITSLTPVRSWFTPALLRRVLSSSHMITVDRFEGPGRQNPAQVLIRRMDTSPGQTPMLIFSAIDLYSMGSLLPSQDGRKQVVALFNHEGQIVSVYPKRKVTAELTPAFTRHIWKVIRMASDDNPRDMTLNQKTIGYAMIGNGLGYVVTVISTKELYLPASLQLWRNLGITLLILTLTAALGWKLLLAPLVKSARSLKTAAEALAGGDLDARTESHEGSGELGHVAKAFNAMAKTLSDRTRLAEHTSQELAHLNRVHRIQSQVQRIPVANGEMSEFLELICTTATRDGEIAGTWIVTMDRPDYAPKVLATSGLEEKITDCRNQRSCNRLCSVRLLLTDALRSREPRQASMPLKGIGSDHEAATVVVYPNVADPDSSYLVIFYILEHSYFTSEYRALIDELGAEIHGRIVAAEAVRKASYLETHDPVTGLLNRASYIHHLRSLLPTLPNGGLTISVSVLALDFVNLGRIARLNGQNIADEACSLIASRLSALTSFSGALLAHTPTGFFCTLFRLESIHALQHEAESIASALSAPFTVSNGEILYPEFRVGLSLAPKDGEQAEVLIDRARQALSHPTEDRVVFFSKAIDTQIQEDRRLETALRDAIENGELEFHYQPVVDAGSGRVVGFETLARWLHGPNGGPVSPTRFIPIAERSQLINALGNLALQTAVRQAMRWAKAGHTGLRISLNVSALQLRHPDFLKDATAALDLDGITLASNRIAFEITESLLVDNTDEIRKLLLRLNDLGFLLYLDDFGTGWSSLSYLHTLPFHTLKIDRSFVHPIAENRKIYGIARTIQACADMLKLDVIAEGVETEVQATLLRKMGCRYIQGYFTGRPLPADAATRLLAGQLEDDGSDASKTLQPMTGTD